MDLFNWLELTQLRWKSKDCGARYNGGARNDGGAKDGWIIKNGWT